MILRADALGYQYPHRKGGIGHALRDLSAVFVPGEVTVLLGPNGSGKTTLLRLLAGLITPSQGIATINGMDISHLAPCTRARMLAYIPQRDEDTGDFTVLEAIAMGRFAYAMEHASPSLSSRACAQAGLGELAHRRVGTLSAGQRQRVVLARALCQVQGVSGAALLADEPAAALDPAYATISAGLLRQHADSGATVVVAMHDLNAAARLADRVLVLAAGGKVVAHGPPDSTMSPDVLRQAFGASFQRISTSGGDVYIPDPYVITPAARSSPYPPPT